MVLTIDSSVFISIFQLTEPFHELSSKFFKFILEKKIRIVIPILVYFELINSFARKARKKTGIQQSLFQELDRIFFESEEFYIFDLDYQFLEDFRNYAPKFALKTHDNILAVTAYLAGANLISWDRRLIKEAKNHISAFTPQEFLKKARR